MCLAEMTSSHLHHEKTFLLFDQDRNHHNKIAQNMMNKRLTELLISVYLFTVWKTADRNVSTLCKNHKQSNGVKCCITKEQNQLCRKK